MTTYDLTTPWVEDSELDAVVTLLGTTVTGLPDTNDPQRGLIDDWGVGSNANVAFANDTFAIRDFCWCEGSLHPETVDWEDDETLTEMPPSGGTSSGCPLNFEHYASGIGGYWYKHLGRENRYNREARPGEAVDILLDCLVSIGRGRTTNRWQKPLSQWPTR